MIIRVDIDIPTEDDFRKVVANAVSRQMFWKWPRLRTRADLLGPIREYLASYGMPEDFPEGWEDDPADQDHRRVDDIVRRTWQRCR